MRPERVNKWPNSMTDIWWWWWWWWWQSVSLILGERVHIIHCKVYWVSLRTCLEAVEDWRSVSVRNRSPGLQARILVSILTELSRLLLFLYNIRFRWMCQLLCVRLYDHSFLCVREARRYKEVPLAAVFTAHKELALASVLFRMTGL